jgi:hypothetical protein
MERRVMDDFRLSRFLTIETLIAYVRQRREREVGYDIYSRSGDDFSATDTVFVDHTLQADDNDREVYPEAVLTQQFRFAYSGQQFQDVIDLAFRQKPGASTCEIIAALNHYAEHDDFLNLDTP